MVGSGSARVCRVRGAPALLLEQLRGVLRLVVVVVDVIEVVNVDLPVAVLKRVLTTAE